MKIHWLDSLACPCCRAELRVAPEGTGQTELTDADLSCTGCGMHLELRDDILSAVPVVETGSAADMLKEREIAKRDEQAEQYDSLFEANEILLEQQAVIRALKPHSADVILDLGMGTGLITEAYARRVCGVAGIDFSRRSLFVARDRLRAAGVDYCLVHGDICALPFRREAFSAVVSTQTFEHVPSEALRQQALTEIDRVLTSPGRLVMTVYYHSPERRLRHHLRPGTKTAKEGFHSGGSVYYYSYGRGEFARFLAGHFRVEQLRGVCQVRPYLAGYGKAGLAMERLLQPTPLSFLAADILLAAARK